MLGCERSLQPCSGLCCIVNSALQHVGFACNKRPIPLHHYPASSICMATRNTSRQAAVHKHKRANRAHVLLRHASNYSMSAACDYVSCFTIVLVPYTIATTALHRTHKQLHQHMRTSVFVRMLTQKQAGGSPRVSSTQHACVAGHFTCCCSSPQQA